MKQKTFASLLARLFIIGLFFSASSCSSDDYLNEREIQQMIDKSLNGQWQVVPIKIQQDHWVWNSNPKKDYKGYYSATIDLPKLTKNIFDEGAVIAYIKHDDNSKTTLPYVQVYDFEYKGKDGKMYDGTYTENISCDFKLGSPSTVTFIIEASDRERFDNYLIDRHFQVVLIW